MDRRRTYSLLGSSYCVSALIGRKRKANQSLCLLLLQVFAAASLMLLDAQRERRVRVVFGKRDAKPAKKR